MKRSMSLVLIVAVCGAGLAVALESPEQMPPPRQNDQFQLIKQLEGDWIELDESNQPTGMTAQYRLTAGGGTLIETIFAGTPMEMVTVFFVDGDNLKLTHYCVLQNQPTMQAKPTEDFNVIDFEFTEGTNIDSAVDPHMHRAKFTFLNQDHYQAEWTHFENGEAGKTVALNMVRAPKLEEPQTNVETP